MVSGAKHAVSSQSSKGETTDDENFLDDGRRYKERQLAYAGLPVADSSLVLHSKGVIIAEDSRINLNRLLLGLRGAVGPRFSLN